MNDKLISKYIKESIETFKLNLNGRIIFTEAATGLFAYTPIMAALAGSKKVYAIAKNCGFGSVDEVRRNIVELSYKYGVNEIIEVVDNRDEICISDIVTNLGNVRPINKNLIDLMNKDAVICCMCESWEIRKEDLDYQYAIAKGIPVVATNENYENLNTFEYSGYLALKLLFEAGMKVYNDRIIILSNDIFGEKIYSTLVKLNNKVKLISSIENNYEILKETDILLVADYKSDATYISKSIGQITGKKLKELSPYITIINFAGYVDINELDENEINYYPKGRCFHNKMVKTFDYLNPKPCIDLLCAGLKVGEITFKEKLDSINIDEFKSKIEKYKLCEMLTV